ncbi:MAG: hypothetical protein FWH04_05765 [Oscillospiraceae bacterium]|nr:hypothetical protein [Oscillospiraceae bacterium]
MKKLKKKHIIAGIIVLILLVGVGYFFRFTNIGYFVTVQHRGFNEIQDRVYLDADYPSGDMEVLSALEDAEGRLKEFLGDLESNPTIIISGNRNKLTKMGLGTSPAACIRIGAICFIVVSSDGMNTDVISHELTHAELYARLYKGKLLALTDLVPSWFNEGVALQNDYRENYNEDAWSEATNNGRDIVDLTEIDTPQKFYSGDESERRYKYIISKHEVKEWLDTHGVEGLISLADDVNTGKSFEDLYYAK